MTGPAFDFARAWRGVCVQLHAPVRCLDPTGLLRHPGATLTVADTGAPVRALEAA